VTTPIHDQLAAETLDETALIGQPVHYTHRPAHRHSLCGQHEYPAGTTWAPRGTAVTCADCIEFGETRFCVRCGGHFT
jgi:hypothetical protein